MQVQTSVKSVRWVQKQTKAFKYNKCTHTHTHNTETKTIMPSYDMRQSDLSIKTGNVHSTCC